MIVYNPRVVQTEVEVLFKGLSADLVPSKIEALRVRSDGGGEASDRDDGNDDGENEQRRSHFEFEF